jgi:ketosteroid isomerase-like protein
MADEASREPARDPQDLERLLVTRQRAGDVDGMTALFEPEAIVDVGEGQVLRGTAAIRAFFADVVASGHQYAYGEQQPARICGELALTSTRSLNGSVTAEVARRQADGTWLWVIDVFTIA